MLFQFKISKVKSGEMVRIIYLGKKTSYRVQSSHPLEQCMHKAKMMLQ